MSQGTLVAISSRMQRTIATTIATAVTLAAFSITAFAIPPDAIKLAKKSTALVTLKSGARERPGIAFCVDESGIFVMSTTFVERLAIPEAIELRLQGDDEKQVVFASLVRSDPKSGVAILQALEERSFAALPVAGEIKTSSREPWASIGVIGDLDDSDRDNGDRDDGLEIRSIRPGVISRPTDDKSSELQFADALAANMQGGPILNAAGELAGMAKLIEGSKATHAAIAVEVLQAQALQPTLRLSAPVTGETPEKETPVEIQLTAPLAMRKAAQIELVLIGSLGQRRVLTAPATKLRTEFTLIPSPVPPDDRRYRIRAVFEAGAVEGFATDLALQLGAESVSLANLLTYTSDKGGASTWVDGSQKIGRLSSPSPFSIHFQSQSIPIDLTNVREMSVSDERRVRAPTKYQLSLATPNGKVGVVEGTFEPKATSKKTSVASTGTSKTATYDTTDLIDAPLWQPINPDGEFKRFDLINNNANQVIVGGAGRYLILLSRSAQAIALFDVAELKFIKSAKLPTSDVHLAATRSKVFAVFPGLSTAWEMDLATLEREEVLEDVLLSKAVAAAAGSHSDGPLIVVLEHEAGKRRFTTIDQRLTRLSEPAYRGEGVYQVSDERDFSLRVSGDGGVAVVCTPQSGAVRRRAFDLLPNLVQERRGHFEQKMSRPGVDGRYVFTSNQVENPYLRATSPSGPALPWLATQNPYLGVRLGGSYRDERGAQQSAPMTIALLEGSRFSCDIPVPLGDISWSDFDLSYQAGALSLDERFHIYPFADLVIHFSSNGDLMLAKKVPFRKALTSIKGGHLYVVSSPPRTVESGELVRYAPQWISSRSEIQVELLHGPTGASVEGGVLLWRLPPAQPLSPVTFALRIKSPDGALLVHHSFVVDVVAPKQPSSPGKIVPKESLNTP